MSYRTPYAYLQVLSIRIGCRILLFPEISFADMFVLKLLFLNDTLECIFHVKFYRISVKADPSLTNLVITA